MKRSLSRPVLCLVVVIAVLLGSCGGDNDDSLLGSFTGKCPKGPLGYWDCNMAWDRECWH